MSHIPFSGPFPKHAGETIRPEPTGKRFTYLVIDAAVCYAKFGPKDPDSYLSRDDQTDLLTAAIDQGYKWIRTENDKAIWEKEWGV